MCFSHWLELIIWKIIQRCALPRLRLIVPQLRGLGLQVLLLLSRIGLTWWWNDHRMMLYFQVKLIMFLINLCPPSPRSRHVVSRGHHHHYQAPVVEKRVHVTHEVGSNTIDRGRVIGYTPQHRITPNIQLKKVLGIGCATKFGLKEHNFMFLTFSSQVHHIVHKRRRRPRPVVHVVEDTRPEVKD